MRMFQVFPNALRKSIDILQSENRLNRPPIVSRRCKKETHEWDVPPY